MFSGKLKKISWLSALFIPILVLCIEVPTCKAALSPLKISESTDKEIRASSLKNWVKDFSRSRDEFAQKYGTSFYFLFNYAEQAILHSKNDAGKLRSVWYWNLAAAQKLWPGGSLIAEIEVDKNKGVDKFLPTLSGFNVNSGDNLSLYVPRFYLEQNLCKEKIYLALGKLDLSDWFDASQVATSGDTQFLSTVLTNNPVIPFPAKGTGAMIDIKPYDWLYFQSGASTAKAVTTKVGLNNAFDGVFFINELGLSPKFGSLQGNYRFMLYLDHQKLEFLDAEDTKNNDLGYSVSFDQAITQWLTLFLRYGYADRKVRVIQHFWSFGGGLAGPIPGRKRDVLGLAVAQSIVGRDYREANGSENTAYAETMYETYYSYSFNEILTFSPNLQFVVDPNADKNVDNELVCGVRLLLSF